MWFSIIQRGQPCHLSICHVSVHDQGLRTLWVHSTMKTGNKNSQPVAIGPCCTQTCWTVRDADAEKSGRVGLWVGWRRWEGDLRKTSSTSGLHVNWTVYWCRGQQLSCLFLLQTTEPTALFPLSLASCRMQ